MYSLMTNNVPGNVLVALYTSFKSSQQPCELYIIIPFSHMSKTKIDVNDLPTSNSYQRQFWNFNLIISNNNYFLSSENDVLFYFYLILFYNFTPHVVIIHPLFVQGQRFICISKCQLFFSFALSSFSHLCTSEKYNIFYR